MGRLIERLLPLSSTGIALDVEANVVVAGFGTAGSAAAAGAAETGEEVIAIERASE